MASPPLPTRTYDADQLHPRRETTTIPFETTVKVMEAGSKSYEIAQQIQELIVLVGEDYFRPSNNSPKPYPPFAEIRINRQEDNRTDIEICHPIAEGEFYVTKFTYGIEEEDPYLTHGPAANKSEGLAWREGEKNIEVLPNLMHKKSTNPDYQKIIDKLDNISRNIEAHDTTPEKTGLAGEILERLKDRNGGAIDLVHPISPFHPSKTRNSLVFGTASLAREYVHINRDKPIAAVTEIDLNCKLAVALKPPGNDSSTGDPFHMPQDYSLTAAHHDDDGSAAYVFGLADGVTGRKEIYGDNNTPALAANIALNEINREIAQIIHRSNGEYIDDNTLGINYTRPKGRGISTRGVAYS
jgi:hypothetical protein